jgi:hypothetical protein
LGYLHKVRGTSKPTVEFNFSFFRYSGLYFLENEIKSLARENSARGQSIGVAGKAERNNPGICPEAVGWRAVFFHGSFASPSLPRRKPQTGAQLLET